MSSVPVRLAEIQFSDLFLSSDPHEPTLALNLTVPGADREPGKRPRAPVPLPNGLLPDAARLLDVVEANWAQERFAAEFTVHHDGIDYRCARIIAPTAADRSGSPDGEARHWCLRRLERRSMDLADLGLPRWAGTELRRIGAASGLLLVAGSFGSGKSTTAAACFLEWIRAHGGIGVTLEDPPERVLDGAHDGGRVYQVPIRGEGFGSAIKASRRWAYRYLYLGEVRDGRAASELLQISLGGPTVITTIHASSTVEALMALSKFAAQIDGVQTANDQIAASILGVVWQQLDQGRLRMEYLSFRGRNGEAMRTKVAESKFRLLREDQEYQAKLRTLGRIEDSF